MFDKSVRTGTWGHPKVLNHVEAGPKFDSDSPGTDFSEQSVFEYAGVSRSRYVQILVSKLVEYGRSVWSWTEGVYIPATFDRQKLW